MRLTEHYNLRVMDDSDFYDVNDFNKNTESIDNLMYSLNEKIDKAGSGGSTAIEHTVTIPAADWAQTEHTATVSVDDVTSNSLIMLCIPMNIPSEEFNQIYIARINPIAIQINNITLKAFGYPPSSDIHISFVIMNKR